MRCQTMTPEVFDYTICWRVNWLILCRVVCYVPNGEQSLNYLYVMKFFFIADALAAVMLLCNITQTDSETHRDREIYTERERRQWCRRLNALQAGWMMQSNLDEIRQAYKTRSRRNRTSIFDGSPQCQKAVKMTSSIAIINIRIGM